MACLKRLQKGVLYILVKGLKWAYTFSIGICILLFLFFFVLPTIVNIWLSPCIEENIPADSAQVRLQRITPYCLSASCFVAKDQATFSAPKIDINFSPEGLYEKHIDSIVLKRPLIQLPFDNGRIKFPQFTKVEKEEKQSSLLFPLLIPIGAKEIRIEEGELLLPDRQNPEKSISIAFSAVVNPKITRQNTQFSFTGGTIKLITKGAFTSHITFDVNLSEQSFITIIGTLHSLAQFERFLPPEIQLNGVSGIQSSISFDKEFSFDAYSANMQIQDFSLQHPSFQTVDNAVIKLTANGNGQFIRFTLDNVSLRKPEKIDATLSGIMDFASHKLTVEGECHTPYSRYPVAVTLKTQLDKTEKTEFHFAGKEFAFGPVSLGSAKLNGELQLVSGSKEGTIHFSSPRLIGKDKKGKEQYRLERLALSLPFQFPYQKKKKRKRNKGRIDIGKIIWQKTKMGQLSGNIYRVAKGFSGKLTLRSPLLKNFCSTCDATLDIPPSTFATDWHCRLPWAEFDSANLPKKFFSLPEDLVFTGKIGGKAELSFVDGRFSGKANISISNGEIQQGSNTLSGIHTSLFLPDITRMQSAPDQRLTIEKIESGKIHAENAKIRWRMENPTSLFIESILMEWCGGRVESACLRLSKETKEIDTTLYCDRLLLSDVLEQFSIGDASGEVSLNGRIPLLLSHNNVEIQDGFLYTTPGDTGVISFENAEQISSAIVADATPYLSYSIDSLKNFTYNWIKLLLNSEEGGNLLMQLQLDGKPAKPLPYMYKRGRIVPITKKGSGTGLQHPVHFDVNFHIPLQQIFQYGSGYQSLLDTLEESL